VRTKDVLVPLVVLRNVLLRAEEFVCVYSDGLKLALQVFFHSARDEAIHLLGPCALFGHISEYVLSLGYYRGLLEGAEDISYALYFLLRSLVGS
jgi:hypothetical protein